MYYETAYPTLLNGVSQQLPQSRIPGQLESQTNMVSDLVRGLCRRGGTNFVRNMASKLTSNSEIQHILTRLGGTDVLLTIDPTVSSFVSPFQAFDPRTGSALTVNLTDTAGGYLEDLNAASRFYSATVGDTAVLVCPNISPVVVNATVAINSKRAGYFYIASGAYSQDYTVKIVDSTSGTTYTASIQTPDGTVAAHVTDSTPEQVAINLQAALATALPPAYALYRDGAYVFIKSTSQDFSVISDTSQVYIQVSNNSLVRQTNTLPARLPPEANGYTVRIGNDATATHFRYDSAKAAWLEDAQPDARKLVRGLGLVLTRSGNVITIDRLDTKARAAGDTVSNPDLACMSVITGVAAFQGRLVLLSDQYVCMSAVNDPTQWYRATVTAILDSDPIEIALTTSYASSYRSGVVFNGNLLILADSHQVQVPGDIPITPTNATMALVANYGIRAEFSAAPLGRSLILPTNTGDSGVGFVETLPPENLEAMLRATTVTSHIPTYIPGALRFVSASNTADTLICGSRANEVTPYYNTSNVYVHQFMWAGNEKVHSAWHKWTFHYPVDFAYILDDRAYFVTGGTTGGLGRRLSYIDIRRGYVPEHYLDFAQYGSVATTMVGGESQGYIGSFTANSMDASLGEALRAYKVVGSESRLGENPGYVTISSNVYFSVSGTTGDKYYVGLPFTSEFTPTPPIVRDRSDNFLASQRIPLLKFIAQVNNTGAVQVRVKDRVYDSGTFDAPVVPHSALQTLGDSPLYTTGKVNVPCRTEARDTLMSMQTSDYYDMNITSLEYGFKLQLKSRRA